MKKMTQILKIYISQTSTYVCVYSHEENDLHLCEVMKIVISYPKDTDNGCVHICLMILNINA